MLAELLPGFLPAFVAALGVNLGIAAAAVAVGLVCGLPLALLRLRGGWAGAAAGALVAPLRAAPTFVVMFFLFNVLPGRLSLGGLTLTMTPWWAVVMALAVYATAYVSDTALDALAQWRSGSRAAPGLFLMGLARAFFVMVLSSGFGAAVGVVEATTVTLRALEALPGVGPRLALMALVTAFFVLVFQSVYAAIDALRRRLLATVSAR